MAYSVKRLTWADAPLAVIPMPVGSMALSRSLASGLCRTPADPPTIFWGVGDRGPNIKPDICADRYGAEHLRPLAALDGAKIMPLPAIGPALARFRIDGDVVVLEAVIDIRTRDGQPVSGLPVPYGQHAEFEPVFDLSGAPLPTDPDGADSEGIAALPDGSFWIADEYGPSLLQVDRAGTLLRRWVPAGEGASYAGANYPVVEALPALASARKLNRGFEGIAVSPDGAIITLAFQSPLAHPDRAAHERSRHVRIWQLDGASGALLAEYLYPLDDPDSFLRDAALGNVGRDDIKISELQLLDHGNPGGDLLVLERVTQSTKIYRVTLDPALAIDPAHSDPATHPTIEQQSRRELRAAGIPMLAKTLVLSTDDCPQICADLEGMILLDDHSLLLVNDSDFGIEGAETMFWRVRFDAAIAEAGLA